MTPTQAAALKIQIRNISENANEASDQSRQAYAKARLCRKSGNNTMYRFWMLRGYQMHAHYEGYRNCVMQLLTLDVEG